MDLFGVYTVFGDKQKSKILQALGSLMEVLGQEVGRGHLRQSVTHRGAIENKAVQQLR